MATLTRIDVTIQTGDRAGAGADGRVYLGIAGREFRCDSTADDFERGSRRTYTFGDGSNVVNGNLNDPRTPQLTVEAVNRFPVYIRFEQEPAEGTFYGFDGRPAGQWNLDRATVHLNGSSFHHYETSVHLDGGLWLGRDSGGLLYLEKHGDAISPS
jgi:hypothetical protein